MLVETTIKIRRGLNGFRYSACDSKGHFIINGEKISDLTNYWKQEKRMGLVRFERELKKKPIDMRAAEMCDKIRIIYQAIGAEISNEFEE